MVLWYAHLRGDRRAGGSIEFAFVALPLITFILILCEIGYDFFAQVALDYGVQTAARQMQVGKAQDAITAVLFQANYLCPAVRGLLDCSSITLNVVPVTTDFAKAVATMRSDSARGLNTSAFAYCPGAPNQLMLVQAVYTSPSLIAALAPGVASTSASLTRATVSSTTFINENFPVTTASLSGC